MGWRKVSEWGPPTPSDFPIMAQARFTDGRPSVRVDVAASPLFVSWVWQPTDEWCPIEVPADGDYEPAPLPAPWRPMSEAPVGVFVLVANPGSRGTPPYVHLWRLGVDQPADRTLVAWCPLPEYPHTAVRS